MDRFWERALKARRERLPCTYMVVFRGPLVEKRHTYFWERFKKLERSRADGETSRADRQMSGADGEKSHADREMSRADRQKSHADGERSRTDRQMSGADGETSRADRQKSSADGERSRADRQMSRADQEMRRADGERGQVVLSKSLSGKSLLDFFAFFDHLTLFNNHIGRSAPPLTTGHD